MLSAAAMQVGYSESVTLAVTSDEAANSIQRIETLAARGCIQAIVEGVTEFKSYANLGSDTF